MKYFFILSIIFLLTLISMVLKPSKREDSTISPFTYDKLIDTLKSKTLKKNENTDIENISIENTPTESTNIENIFDVHNLGSIFLVVNKKNPLPSDYVPNDLVEINALPKINPLFLRKEAADAYFSLVMAAKNDGVHIVAGSSYRSFNYQNTLYNNYVNTHGKEESDRFSARPGYSEHQTGLCIDLVQGNGSYDGYNYTWRFENTDIARWMDKNAHKYGFVLRFPKGKEDVTGYYYEPWHYRYIGVYHANILKTSFENGTLEEYFLVAGGKY